MKQEDIIKFAERYRFIRSFATQVDFYLMPPGAEYIDHYIDTQIKELKAEGIWVNDIQVDDAK